MKILCLHGMGCSGVIFKAQTTAIRRLLGGDQHEFFFLDGEVECEPAPGISDVAPPPYLCYHKSLSIKDIADAHDQVQAAIEEHGPFDGVMGFSQGSSLALSILLHHELTYPDTKPPFNFALLFSATMCFSPDRKLHINVIEQLLDTDFIPGGDGSYADTHSDASNGSPDETISSGSRSPSDDKDMPDKATLLEIATELRELLDSIPHEDNANWRTSMAPFEANPFSEDSTRPYLPRLTQKTVGVPTLHVYGTTDPGATQADIVYLLSSEKERKLIKHEGGHDVPRDKESLAIFERFGKEVMERGRLVASGVL